MAVQLAYDGETERNNTKGILLKGTLAGNYGVNGVGDLLNLAPSQNNGADGGITDPTATYNLILSQVPASGHLDVVQENLAGGYVQITPNANPTLKNFGLRVFSAGGVEKATNAAYTAAELAGNFELMIFIPAQ